MQTCIRNSLSIVSIPFIYFYFYIPKEYEEAHIKKSYIFLWIDLSKPKPDFIFPSKLIDKASDH